LKQRQKICLNLLIKKKRIAQLINGKPGKNHYNKTIREQHLKSTTSKPTSTLNPQPRTPGAPRRKEDPNKYITDNPRGFISQAAAEDFLATPFFLLLPPDRYLLERVLHHPDHVLQRFPHQDAGNIFAISYKLASKLQSSAPK
jgi:hypothetical protein